jgi:uncharacterized protein Yka (UPF0111/DUF47 family)
MKKEIDSVEEFDFGFSFVDEEYEAVKEDQGKLRQENKTSKGQVKDLEERLDLLYRSILPFLNNLCKNPENSTILWPDRLEKIEQFKDRLKNIAEGKEI